MRIISGIAGRRKLQVPKAVSRPSTDRMREALFSILGEGVKGSRVLDLFAGSGALGLEALSRGGEHCDFVDENREAAGVIKRNLKDLGLAGGAVHHGDVFSFLKAGGAVRGKYDYVFADPPYFKRGVGRDFAGELFAMECWGQLLADGGYLIVEDDAKNKREEFKEGNEVLELLAKRKYGGCGVWIFGRKEQSDA